MKNKTLMIGLGILCALFILETGYLIGIGEERTSYVYTAPRFEYVTPAPIQHKSRSFFVAAMTSRETPQATIITINLPGLDKREIKIEAKGRDLTVLAGQESAANFVQKITLPDNVRPEEIRAEFSNENLTITIPKDKKARRPSGKTINIPIG